MYIPKLYTSEDFSLMRNIIDENAFAMLISNYQKIHATHAMMLFNPNYNGKICIETHISRANPQASLIKNGDTVLCDFLGNHTYVSSSWYKDVNVSTWNYEAVQIYGSVEVMDEEALYQHLEKLTLKFERNQKCPMLVEKMGKNFVEKEMQGAFGIIIFPNEIYIKQKLSQNRNDEDYQNIITELSSSNVENSRVISEKMKRLRNL